MNAIPTSVVPPRNLDKEEPELAQEDDIPADDSTVADDDGDIERE
jgi:hypothetical protein